MASPSSSSREGVDVLVTGSSGQVGSSLYDALLARGVSACGIDRRPSRCATLVGDVRSAPLPPAATVVHCAAEVSVVGSVEAPRHDASINVDGTLAILDHARRHDARRVVFLSSAAVYGVPDRLPVGEDHPLRPLSPYGLSKLTGEAYARMYHALYGLPVVILRPFNIFSARQDPGNPYSGVIARFLAHAREGQPLPIRGAGDQTRDFIHVEDVVRAILQVLDDPRAVGGTFNLGRGEAVSILDLARLVARAVGKDTGLRHVPAVPGEIPHSLADVRALRALGYEPLVGLEEGLRRVARERTWGPVG